MATIYCCTNSTALKVVDTATGAVTATVTLSGNGRMAGVSPDGTKVAVAFNDTPNGHVQLVDATTNTPGTTVTLSGIGAPYGVVWVGNTTFYVKCVANVVPISAAGVPGTPITFTGSSLSTDLCLSPDGTKLYTGGDSTSLIEITIASGSITNTWHNASVTNGFHSVCITPDGHTLYAADNQNRVWPLTIATGTFGTALTFSGASGIRMTPDGSLAVCSAFSANVPMISTASSTVAHTATVANAIELAVLSDGSQAWVCDYSDGKIVPVSLSTFTAGTAVTLGTTNCSGVGAVPVPSGPPPPVSGAAAVAVGPLTVTVPTSTAGSGGSFTAVAGRAVLNLGPLSIIAADFVIEGQGRAHIGVGPLKIVALGGRLGPGAWPVPGYRGRWRLTLHARAFAAATLASTMIAELADARGRQLVQAWNTPATLTFTLDGHSQAAGLVEELLHDVVAWRWDDQTGSEIPVFRGPVTQSQDTLDEQSHTVAYTCHDYQALLTRRLITTTTSYAVTSRDQDLIVGDLLALASSATTSSGTSLSPASFLPVGLLAVNGDGSLRGLSGQLLNVTYYGSQNIGDAVAALATAVNGFDYDVRPSGTDDHDSLRVFFPAQGVTRTDMALQYGSTVATVQRSVDSSVYANYVRALGNKTSTAPTPQLYAEAWDPTAASISTTPVGLWMTADDASAVTVASQLAAKASGDLALDATLVPTYTLGLAAGAYEWGSPNMGDTVPLIVQSGRLNVNSTARVLGITYNIGDDGQEDVALVVGRPATTLAGLLGQADRDVKSLALR